MSRPLFSKSLVVTAGSAAVPLMVKDVIALKIEVESGGELTISDTATAGTNTSLLKSDWDISFPEPVGIYWSVSAASASCRIHALLHDANARRQ